MAVGLLKEGINEVIATTRNNAAPMGMVVRDGEVRMVIFRGSHTAERIAADGWIAANFVYDPVIYVTTAFDDLPAEAFTPVIMEGITFDRLVVAEAWAGFRAEVERMTSEALLVRLSLICEEIMTPVIHPVNRGFNSIIEATVHATRWVRTQDPELAMWIRHHAGIVRKCGGQKENIALSLLISHIPGVFSHDELVDEGRPRTA